MVGACVWVLKQDAIPGFIRDTWFTADEPGIYRGQCTELCGKDHGFMPIVVEVLDEEAYSEWVAEKIAAASNDNVNLADAGDAVKAGEEKSENN